MKYRKLLSRALLIFAVSGVLLGINLKAKADETTQKPFPQVDAVNYLEQRLKEQNVPVAQIKVLQDSPLQVEIDIQSTSDGDKWMPEDFANLHIAFREVVLALDNGYNIERYTQVLLNKNGKNISWERININGEISYTKLPSSNVQDSIVRNLVDEKINTYGMPIVDEKISSYQGLQTLKFNLSTASLDTVNQELPKIRSSLPSLVKDINSQGAQIVMVVIQVKDKTGKFIVNYMLDLQFGTEGWWIADGINFDSWYPSIPASVP